MGQIVAATGVEVPGFAAQQAALLQGSRTARHHTENTQAALWVGDLKRADALLTAGPEFDLAAMGVPASDDDAEEDDLTFDTDDDDVQALLATMGLEGFDPDEEAVEAPDLYAAIARGEPGAIADFLKTGADPNLPSGTPRHSALLAALDAPGRRVEHIAALIDAGADARAIHAYGDNTLLWAMGYHHPETVTPESEAAVIACLVAHGADPGFAIEGQWNILQRAIVQGGAALVAAVLAVGADVTACISDGFEPEKLAGCTPLMLAAPKPDIVRLLLGHGADPLQPDASGRIPLDFVEAEAIAARARAEDDWTIRHADDLETSLRMIRDHGAT